LLNPAAGSLLPPDVIQLGIYKIVKFEIAQFPSETAGVCSETAQLQLRIARLQTELARQPNNRNS
jgi:hypothetical protein